MRFFHMMWRGEDYQSPPVQRFARQINAVCGHRRMPWILFALGLLRALVSLLAYPPAHGADSFAYFFYAQRFTGMTEVAGLSQLVPPLYPLFILATYGWLGSAYWLIGLQVLMSAAIVPLFYLALRRYSPVFAIGAALVILLDFQVAVLFNFISTEPLYMFLLALSFWLFLRQSEAQKDENTARDALPGFTLLLLMLTRAVGRFLIVPLLVVFWLRTRSWRRSFIFLAGFLITLVVFSLISGALLGEVEGTTSSDYMVTGVVLRNTSWLTAENGPASAEFLDVRTACADRNFYDCYYSLYGSHDGMIGLIFNTLFETLAANWQPFVGGIIERTEDFLALSGQQFGLDQGLPSELQCADVDSFVDALTPETLLTRGWGWTWGIREFTDSNFEQFRELYRPMRGALCPPLPGSPLAKTAVDYLMFRYRSLARPQPFLWYGALTVLVLAVPWARRYWLPFLTAMAFLFNHALASAALSNVQPRYVVVANPFRAILLVLLAYLILKTGALLVDGMLQRFDHR